MKGAKPSILSLIIMKYKNHIANLSKAMNIPYKINNNSKPSNYKKLNNFNKSKIKFIDVNKFNRYRFNYQNRPKNMQRFIKY